MPAPTTFGRTRIGRSQRTIGKRGPVSSNDAIEAFGSGRIDRIVQLIDPFHVRPETGLAGKIQRQVNPESCDIRNRINKMPRGGAAPA